MSDIIFASIEIVEADEVAVPDLIYVIVVIDVTVWLGKVSGSKGNSRVRLAATVVS